MNLSPEQKEIVTFWENPYEERHLVVNSKAGVGKSTVSIASSNIIYQTFKAHTLILTFSAMLKLQARKWIKNDKCDHVRAESYHSAVSNIFEIPCTDQFSMEMFLDIENPVAAEDLSDIGLLVIDEAQDLTDSYIRLIRKIRCFLDPRHRLMVLGDRFQNVFQALQNSSPKYLDDPKKYFGGTFHSVNLSHSFRVTPNIAEWVNANLDPRKMREHYPDEWAKEGHHITAAWGSGIQSSPLVQKENKCVSEVSFNFYKDPLPDIIQTSLKHYIDKHGIESVLILVSSCRMYPGHPASRIINMLGGDVRCNWVLLNGEFRENEDLLTNKGTVATPFKMKGRESKLVIMFGLDNSLERWTTKQRPMLSHAIAYVACTRASEKLIVARHSNNQLFFTQKEIPSPPPRRITKATNVRSIVNYAAFDRELDNVESKIVSQTEEVIVDCKTAIGRIDGVYEPVWMWYKEALKISLAGCMWGEEPVPWVDRVKEVIDMHCNKTESMYVSRQLTNYKRWVDCKTLDLLLQSAYDMSYNYFYSEDLHFEFSRPVRFRKVTGEIGFLMNDTNIVEFQCSDRFIHTQAQEGILNAALLFEDDVEVQVFVVNPVIGEIRQVMKPPGNLTRRQYMLKMLERKQLEHLLL